MLSNPKNSAVGDTGVFDLVLCEPVQACKWQFALLAWRPGVTS